MKKIKYLVLLLSASIVLAGCIREGADEFSSTSTESVTISDHALIPIKIGEHTLTVEAVTEPESLTKGLGERDEIGSDGMLFFMPERRVANFWMYGMRFPLDFIWIDGATIVGLEENVLAPENSNSTELPSYSSEVPVTHVLELPAGKIAELSLSVGMKIEIGE